MSSYKTGYILAALAVIGLLSIAYAYYQHTQAVGARDCATYGAGVDKQLGQDLKAQGEMLGQTYYSYKNGACYQDITYTDPSADQHTVHSYIKNVYTGEVVSTCDIQQDSQQSSHCQQYFSDFNRLFWHLY